MIKCPQMDMEKRVTPLGLIRYSQEYFKAYKVIQEKDNSVMYLLLVKYFLLCRSMELAFKTFLRLKGYSLKQLKNILGHDLDKLLSELNTKHNILLDKESLIALEVVNKYYKSKQFEYPQTGYKTYPDIKKLERIVKLFIDKTMYEIVSTRKKK